MSITIIYLLELCGLYVIGNSSISTRFASLAVEKIFAGNILNESPPSVSDSQYSFVYVSFT